MKHILPVLVFFAVNLSLQAIEYPVTDYYKLMLGSLVRTGKYEIITRNGRYFVNSKADEEIEITVDLKNKYLSITDHGTGGGVVSQEFAVFLRSGREPVIGLSETEFDGIGIEAHLNFFEYIDGNWKNVTGSLLKEPDPSDFIDDKDTGTSKLAGEFKEYFSFIYTIPRYGTTMKCSLDYTKLSRMANSDEETPKTIKAKKLEAGLKYNSMEYTWDYKKGIFVSGKKFKE
jgi:hypothetical protein